MVEREGMMKYSILSLIIGGLLFSCTSGNTSYTARTQEVPNDRSERVGSSVSPRSELEYDDSFAGSQSPRNVYSEDVLEPMRSITTRSAPDASDYDATDAGDAVDNTNAAQ